MLANARHDNDWAEREMFWAVGSPTEPEKPPPFAWGALVSCRLFSSYLPGTQFSLQPGASADEAKRVLLRGSGILEVVRANQMEDPFRFRKAVAMLPSERGVPAGGNRGP